MFSGLFCPWPGLRPELPGGQKIKIIKFCPSGDISCRDPGGHNILYNKTIYDIITMVSLEDLLSPSSLIVGILISLIPALFMYFRQAIDSLKDTLNKDSIVVNERLIRLELEIGYREELNKLKEDNNELSRRLSGIQKQRRF